MDFLGILKAERIRAKEQRSLKPSPQHDDDIRSSILDDKSEPYDEEFSSNECSLSALELWSKSDSNHYKEWLNKDIRYIPDCIPTKLEDELLNAIYNDNAHPWTTLHHRRVKCFGGIVGGGGQWTPEPLPGWLSQLLDHMRHSIGAFPPNVIPNHVLVNEYNGASSDCILPHQDGPRYAPYVIIISLQASATMSFYRHRSLCAIDTQDSADIATTVARRSLVLFKGQAYTDYLHGVDNVLKSSCRVSLTIRQVL